jgi:hypothetical protein
VLRVVGYRSAFPSKKPTAFKSRGIMSHTKLTLNHYSELLWINTELYLKYNAKSKVSVQVMKACGIAEVSLQPLLTSALNVTSDQYRAPADLSLGKATPVTYWMEGCVDPTTGLDDLDVIILFIPAWNRTTIPWTFSPYPSHYTDYKNFATPSTLNNKICFSNHATAPKIWIITQINYKHC